MKKDIEQFIAENRAAFDDEPVPSSLWEKVNDRLDNGGVIRPINKNLRPAEKDNSKNNWNNNSRNPRGQWIKIAATLLLAVTLGTTIYYYGKEQGYQDYERINPELAESRAIYDDLVQQRKDSIRVFASQDLRLEAEFVDALSFMELNYEQLKAELQHSPNQERTLRAMILNLQAQAEVLNQQLYILSKLNETKNETL
jgi:hypothetical protein